MQPNQQKHARRDGKITRTPVGHQNTFVSNSNQKAASSTSRHPTCGTSERNITLTKVTLDPAGNIAQEMASVNVQPMSLINKNNACFINTSLQVLFSIPDVRHYISAFSGSSVLQPVTSELARMFREAGRSATACRLRNQLAQATGDERFNIGSEEDSSEFLAVLLSVVEREVQNDQAGSKLMQKFRGKEKIQRKFLTG